MASIADLQRQINRFANDPDIGFAPIACDGVAGPATLSALLYALTSVNLADARVDETYRASAGVQIDNLQKPGDIAPVLDSLLAVLDGGASALGLQFAGCATARPFAAAQPTPPAFSGSPKAEAAQQRIAQAPAAQGNYGAGIWQTIATAPWWAKLVGGVLVGVGIWQAGKHLSLAPVRRATHE